MNVGKIGGWTMGGGLVALIVSFVLGAGPCNASVTGIILMMLGLFAVPIGVIMFVVGLFTKRPKTA